MNKFMQAAIEEARKGAAEGGIPIGSVLVRDNKIVGRGHNRRIQKGSAILHAEMDCIENTGVLKPAEYQQATLYTTLSPCDMCSGAILFYRIHSVIIGENQTSKGPEEYLRSRGIELTVLNDDECKTLLIGYVQTDGPFISKRV